MSPASPPASRATWLLLASYGVVVGAVVLGFGWTWDDRDLIVGGQLQPLGEALGRAWTGDFWSLSSARHQHTSGMYRPLVLTTYILERGLFGLAPGVAHLVNLFLHLGVAALAGVLAAQLGGSRLVATAIVLLHPHAAELVGSVAARTDLLATLGVVASLVLRRMDTPGRDAWAALALLAGCLSKEVAFTGALLWVAMDLLEGRRDPRRWAPGFAAAGAALALRAAFVGTLDPDAGGLAFHPLTGAASTGWALFDLLVPVPAGPWPAPHGGHAGLICLVAVAATWRWSRLLLVWVVVAWSPMAGWLPVEVRASRALLYLPLVGLGLTLGGAWTAVVSRLGSRPERAAVAASLALALLAGLHISSLLPWKTPHSLWSWGVERNADHPLPHLNLGRAILEEEGGQAAESAYRRAAELALARRDAALFVGAASALGSIALERGDEAAARAYLEDAIGAAGPQHAPEAVEMLRSLGQPDQRSD